MTNSSLVKLRVAIVGAGRMGRIRATSIAAHPQCSLVEIVDIDVDRARTLAEEFGCGYSMDWELLPERQDIDCVVVSATHNLLSRISVAALTAGKDVFCEKPMARTPAEAESVIAAIWTNRGSRQPVFRIGCTLRHHPAVSRAHRLVKEGLIGQLFYIRAFYGHGGRPMYDQEWRMVPQLGGGGELLDQGIHLIDLSRWFLGDFPEVSGMIGTYFWTGIAHLDNPVKAHFPHELGDTVEDNAFLLLRTEIGQTASLHASWTQWKNAFSFEIYGREGSLTITGLGGSYGEEQLVHARRRPEGGVPEMNTLLTASGENVWDLEWQAFVAACAGEGHPGHEALSQSATAEDGFEALRMVCAIYEAARRQDPIFVSSQPSFTAP